MARIARRRVLKLSASGAIAAQPAASPPSWPADGRRPWRRRRPSTGCAGPISCRPPTCCSRARSRRNARRRSASTSRSRPSTPTTCSRASPRRSSPAPAPTSSWGSATGRSSTPRAWPTSATWPRRSARPRAATTTSPGRSRTVGNKWIGVPFTTGGGLIAYRKSWLEEAGLQDLPRDLGHLPRGRQEAQGQGAADRPDRGPHLRRRAGLVVSLPVVVWRQGGRGRRQDRRAEQQGNGRVDQVRGRPVEGDHGRRRARLGRHQQQPRLPVPDHQRHQQRRLDLHRGQEEARDVPDREGHADVAGHPARAASPRGRPASTTCRARSPTC